MVFPRNLPSRARAVSSSSSLRGRTRILPVRLLPCGGLIGSSGVGGPHCAFLSSISGGATTSNSGSSVGGEGGSNGISSSEDSSLLFGKQQSLQPFVQARIRPGEWDRERKNPLYRPAFVSRARILSAEDFAKRPKVGTSVTFDNLQNAMVTLTWMNQDTWQQIYDLYLDLMQTSYEKYSKKDGGGGDGSSNSTQHNAGTSHEYILRLLAQRYTITPERAAGIVLLKHKEEQYKRKGHKLLTDVATYMDQMCQQEIDWAYATFDQQKPTDVFIEDPVGVDGHVESKQFTTVDDVLDLSALEKQTRQRFERETQQTIDGHIYKMDLDQTSIPVPTDADCRQLISVQKKLKQQSLEITSVKELLLNEHNKTSQEQQPEWPRPHHPHKSSSSSSNKKKGDEAPPLPLPVLDPRPRWKFVAQTINTRELKKAQNKNNNKNHRHRRRQAYCNNDPCNSLVEEDGMLRVATVADVESVSWKPTRKVNDFIYNTVQEAWLEHVLRNRSGAWGKQQAPKTEEKEKSDDDAAAAAAADGKESETKEGTAGVEKNEEESPSESNNATTDDKVEDDDKTKDK